MKLQLFPVFTLALYFFKFIYFERESTHEWGEGQRERERERQGGREQESQADSTILVQSKVGLDLMNCEIMARAETKSRKLN